MSDVQRKGPGRAGRALASAGEALRRLDSREAVVKLARAGRRRLPGDREYGDPHIVRERIDPERISTRRRWRFKPKGAPKNLKAFIAEPA